MQNPPPIDHPTPYTCPNCGTGLNQLSEFCPRCGARMTERKQSSLGYYLTMALLFVGLLISGGIGACSGYVIFAALDDKSSEGAEIVRSLFIIIVPLCVLGIGGFIWCLWALFRKKRQRS